MKAALSREKEMGVGIPVGQQVQCWAVSVRVSQQRPGKVILPLCLSLVRHHLE